MKRIFYCAGLGLGLCAGLGACSEPGPVKDAPSTSTAAHSAAAGTSTHPTAAAIPPRSTSPVNSATPFEIRLRVEPGPTLVAELHNNAAAPQTVLHDALLQPSELVLTGPGGLVTPFDTRSTQKYDSTVRDESFTTVGAGAHVPLFDAKISGRGGKATLTWGPYQYEALAPGSYRAKVVLHSKVDSYRDDANQSARKSGTWLGNVTSAEVTFQIP